MITIQSLQISLITRTEIKSLPYLFTLPWDWCRDDFETSVQMDLISAKVFTWRTCDLLLLCLFSSARMLKFLYYLNHTQRIKSRYQYFLTLLATLLSICLILPEKVAKSTMMQSCLLQNYIPPPPISHLT